MIKRILLSLTFITGICLSAYAGPEATFNKLHITYQWLPDGAVEMNVSKVLTYHTHTSFNDIYGETFVFYNPEYQSVKINESYTVQKDGTKITTPQNAFNEVLPSAAANAPDYNHLKELVITHTGLELGATVYLDYTVTTKAGYWQALDIDVPFFETGAIADGCLRVIVPQGTPVNAFVSGKAVQSKNSGNGIETYTYTFKDIAANPRETLSAPYDDAVCRVILNTYPAGTNPFDVIAKSFEGRQPNMSLMMMMRSMRGRSKEDLLKFVDQQLASSPLTLQQTGYRMRTADRIMATAYGTQAERLLVAASLLGSMRQEAKVYPVYPASAIRQAGSALALASLTGISLEPQKEAEPLVVNEKSAITLGRKDAQTALFTLPAPKGGVATFKLGNLNSKRISTLELPQAVNETYEYTLSSEEGVKIDAPNREKHLSNAIGSVDIVFQWKGQSLVITRALKINQTVIPAAQYADFRALMTLWNTASWQSVIVR